MLKYVSVLQAMAKAPLTAETLKLAGRFVYQKCDKKDGLADGLIENPRQCDFNPEADLPKCASGKEPECFSEAEIAVLKTLYSDQLIGAERVFPGWPVGVEALTEDGRVGWSEWLVRANGPPISERFAEAFFRYLATPKKDPALNIAQVDLAAVNPQLTFIRQVLNATDADLAPFRDRGGKLLMAFGWADPALNPNMGVEYYESVLKAMGPQTKEFFRLFMMPGVFHCSGGPGCDRAPRVAALINWVERGQAPDRLVAARMVSGRLARTRPLCPYPQTSIYKGSGNTDDAANFTCASPDPPTPGK
jgi:feruloyl esterase